RYIDYYNRHRIKLKLGGMSPMEYRLRAVSH
ncbi:IS3 family transposase, partial [Alcaligenaceae bacterium]|nr:IS3 family transposase [Alcaligenaceae bacterium]